MFPLKLLIVLFVQYECKILALYICSFNAKNYL